LGGRFLLHVGDLQRRALTRRVADTCIADMNVALLDGRDQLFVHAVGGTQLEFLFGIDIFVDRARIRVGELYGLADNGVEHLLQIERGVHRLAHLAERAQLPDRLRQLVRTLLDFFLQVGVGLLQPSPPCR